MSHICINWRCVEATCYLPLLKSAGTAQLQSKDAEQMLWKTVFYTVIEEFRRRIKAATAQGQKGSEPLRKASLSMLSLLP